MGLRPGITMVNFIAGQRWTSDTESELGLGIVQGADTSTVTVLFPACGEKRVYARRNAPLTRAAFSPGDTVENTEGRVFTICRADQRAGLLRYSGKTADGAEITVQEEDLSHSLQFSRPQDRLFAGRIDASAAFELRLETWLHAGRQERSPVHGLLGGRTALLPHQLYIAHEVAGRHAPRVLLADEVGLGKTIEAGLILHHQHLTGRASRILVIVPETLLHQWLVEMLRRFELRFSLFDEARCVESRGDNPFHAEQRVLCSLEFLMGHAERQRQVLDGEWDLLVVDEAHHLRRSEQGASPEYALIEGLAAVTCGVLLLTATPEQLGKSGHFARLRLLDPDRYFSYPHFLEEEKAYRPIADAADALLGDRPLSHEIRTTLAELLSADGAEGLLAQLDDPAGAHGARQALIDLLLDRHGTGRVLFRNTRAAVKGFPERRVHPYPLPAPPDYAAPESAASPAEALYPERRPAHGSWKHPWWRQDPRVAWIIEHVQRGGANKILLICGDPRTAIGLEEALRVRAGIHAAVFHEGMSIVARDRAAAYFAAPDSGARLLICSEIGSEGRNFQFARDLVSFDLPFDPDLLEQRIGRLDRIGQKHTVHIHVPYLAHTAQETLFRWYHDGLNAFRHPAPAAPAVFRRMEGDLTRALQTPERGAADRLIEKTRSLAAALGAELEKGRDRLLELNACRQPEAARLVAEIQERERRDDLWPYLERVFDHLGVDVEDHSAGCHILSPGPHMRLPHFPGLPDDGLTATTDRTTALAREDMAFLTWEHPLVRAAMELMVSGEHGNAAFSLARHPALPAGRLLLEAIFILECPAPKTLQIGRFLPPTPLRCLVDPALNDLDDRILERMQHLAATLDATRIAELLHTRRADLDRMLAAAKDLIDARVPALVAEARRALHQWQWGEVRRLTALGRVNPNVRREEIDHLAQAAEESDRHLGAARVRLDALRVIVTV